MTIPVLYEAPIMLEKNRFSEIVCRELHIDAPAPDMTEWDAMLESIRNRSHRVTIGLVGKYVQLHDAYLSVAEALRHAGYVYGTRVDIQWIDSETITRDNVEEVLGSCDGILVPGGFGNRGIEGKIAAAHYARTHNIPYLGICLGMQIAVIEFARSVCGLADANSGEFDEGSTHKVIDFMPDQSDEINKGGTLRLGAYPCHIVPGTKWPPAMARWTSPSATATGTSSTTTTARSCRKRGSCSPACRRTATSWRPSRSPKTTFTSAFSTIPSSRAARTRRTPCSRG